MTKARFQVQNTFEFIDGATVMGKTYHYEVTSSTTDGYVSEPSNDVAIVRRKPSAPPNPDTFVVPTPVPLQVTSARRRLPCASFIRGAAL